MKKQLSMLMLLAALIVPWASRAQSLGDYTFSTGTDATMWIAVPTTQPSLITAGAGDYGVSTLQNIGFAFPFGEDSFTQFSVNADGNLRLGSTVTGTNNYSTPFSTANAGVNNPKINPMGCDGFLTDSGYVRKYNTVDGSGDSLLVVEFATSTYNTTSRPSLLRWQVQLYPNGNINIVFASTAPPILPNITRQCGMSFDGSDLWLISATHVATHYTAGQSTTIATGTWPNVNRYYSFVRPVITCPKPVGIVVDNVSHDGARIAWSDPAGTASSFHVYYSTDPDFTLDTCPYLTTTDTSILLTNLTHATTYYFALVADCGNGDTSLPTVKRQFTTELNCGEGYAYLNSPVSSGTSSGYTQFAYNYNSTSYAVGHAGMIITAEEMEALGMDGPGTIYSMSVHAGATATSVPLRIYIGKTALSQFNGATDTVGMVSRMTLVFNGTLQTTANNWVTIPFNAPFAYSPDSNLIIYIYRPSVPTGNGTFYYTSTSSVYKAFYGYRSSTSTAALNFTRTYNRTDVKFDICYEIPSCPRPTNLTLDSVDDNSLTLTWTDNGDGASSSFLVDYRVVGTTAWSTIEVYDTTATLTGLNHSSDYEVVVRAYCGVDDTSTSVTGTFRTACAAITPADLPYTEDFEAYGSGSSYPIDPCWAKGVVNYGSSSTTTAYPYPSSTAINGQRSLYFYCSHTSAYNYYNWMVLPAIDDTQLNMSDLMVTFTMKRGSTASSSSSTYTSTLVVGVTTDYHSEAGFVPVDTIDLSSAPVSSVHNVEVSFANYTGTGTYILFYAPSPALTTTSNYNTFYLDDITLRNIPSCFWPTEVVVESVATDEATISWTPDPRTANPSSWNVEYGPHGFTLGNGTTETVYDTTVTLMGLLANTEYDVYVMANCNGDVSDPTSASFRTDCDVMTTLPYVENFDGVTGSTVTSNVPHLLPPCWNKYNAGTRASYQGCPYVYQSTTYAHSGSNCIRFYSYAASGDSNQYLILPMVDSTMYLVSDLKVSFWHRANSTSATYHADVVVGVMTNLLDASSFVPCTTFTSSSTTYAYREYNFGNYNGNQGCIAFKFPVPTASSNYEYGYIDDVTLEVAPTCAPVVSHNVTATASAARITWDYDHDFAHGPDSYEVSYGYAADSLASPTTVTVNDPVVVLTGLTADTAYMVSIQPICTDGTAPAHIFDFSTATLPCAVWDTAGTGGPSDTITVGTPGTSTTPYMPVNNSYNYSYCQHLILSSHLPTTGPQTFSGIAFDYAYSSPMTHATNCQIYMGHTTRSTFAVSAPADSAFVPYNQLTLVYQGPLNCTVNGYNYFNFNQGAFAYDGTSNIIVAIVNNSGSYDGSTYTFRYETTSPAMSHRVYNNTTPYGPTEMDAARANQLVWRTNMKLIVGGAGDCLSSATCYAPLVTAEPDTLGNLVVSWIPGYQETSWDLDYKAEGDNVWTSVLTGTSLTSYTITMESLQPNTNYTFRVSPNCTDTVIAGTTAFTTPCSYINIPFTYGFEDLPTGSTTVRPDIHCWTHINNGTTYFGYPYPSSTTPHSGTRSLYWYLSTTATTYADYELVVLPPVNIATNPINTLQLSFWARPTSTTYAPVFYVGVMNDPEDVTTFQYVDTIVVDHNTTDWKYYEATLDSYTGYGQYVAVRANRPSSAWYAYTDDFTLENIPSCPRVTNVAASNITQNTATVSWNTTVANDYEVQYGATDFTLGNGSSVTVMGVDSIDIYGLAANSGYDVYVRGLCPGNDTGAWSLVYNFRTSCGLIDTLPFFEDFESYTTYTSSSTSTPFIPCWTRLNNGTTYGGVPYISSSTSSYNHTPGGGKYVYWYNATTATTYGDYMYMILPQIDTTELPINTLMLSFWGKTSSTSYNNAFQVGVMDNNTDTAFHLVATVNINGNTEWEEYEVNFDNYTGTGSYIAIRLLRGSATSYAYLDDLTLDRVPLCPRVNDLMATNVLLDSATVVWVDSSNTAWNVEYDTVPFTPGTGHMTPIAVTDTFCVIGGLDSATTYHVYVYPDCNGEAFPRHTTFTTLAAAPATVPYFCDFEGAGPNGWDLFNGNQTNYWMVGNATNNGGSRSLYVTNDGSTNSYTISSISYAYAVRAFQITSPGEYAYSFDWKCQGEGNYDFIRVFFAPSSVNVEGGVLPFGSSSYNFGQTVAPAPYIDLADRTAAPYALNGQANWQTHVGTMNITTPGTYKLIFVWSNDGSGGTTPPGAIDNVSLQQNTCAMVQNVTAYTYSDSISVHWSAGGSETQWVVSMDSTVAVVNDTNYLFTGLTPNSNYTIHIRAICGLGDTSMAYSETYHTPCSAVSLPYTDNFDSYTTSTTAATGVHVPCWDYIMTGSSTYQGTSYQPQVYYGASNAHSGSYSLRLYGESYTMLPPMGAPLDSLQLTFWDYTTSADYLLEVGVMEGNTFVPVQTINTPASTHLEQTVFFVNYTGNSRIIAFRNYNSTSTTYYSYHYIDNVVVDYIPTCPHVVDITVDLVTTDTVQITWTPIGSETEWQVSSNGTTWTSCYDTTYIFAGLNASTQYTFYVRPVCGVGDTGIAQSITTRTTCAAVSLPYTDNFDSYTTSTTAATGVHVPCWDFIMTGSSTYQAATYQPQVYYNASNAHSGSYSLRLYGESYTMLPPMSAPLDSLEMTFWDYCTSANYLLEVGVMEGSTFVPMQSINTPASSHLEHTVYFATYTGSSRIIAFRNHNSSTSSYLSYHYIDNIDVHYLPTCPRVLGVHDTMPSSTSLTVDWVDQGTPTSWQLRYGQMGGTTTTTVNVSSHPYTINGLDAMTAYTVEVRPICSATDTGLWSQPVSLVTAMCDNSFIATTVTASSTQGTSYVVPVNNFYNYTLTETIIDSAELIGISEISAIAYNYAYATASTDKTDVTIWLQPTNKSTFSSTSDMVALNTATAVQVYHGPLNCSQGWNYFSFDTNYTWNGHGNLLVIVDDNSGDYNGNSYIFNTATCSGNKTIAYYSDSENPSATSPSSFSGSSKYTYAWRTEMQLISCGGCSAPIIGSITKDYESATITVAGQNLGYDMYYGTTATNLPNHLTSTSGTFNLSGLNPATTYYFRVTQTCLENETSPAAESYFTTDSLPCMPVTNIQINGSSYNSVTVGWTPVGDEHAWEVRVASTVDTHFASSQVPTVTVYNLVPQRLYNVNVRPLCGASGTVAGPWCDTIVTFTTDACTPVTNVNVSDITASSATVSWTAPAGATNFRVLYGFHDFDVNGEIESFNTTSNPFALTGLEANTPYTVRVAVICTESLFSSFTSADFTTANVGIFSADNDGALSLYPNPASTTVTLRVSEQLAGSTISIVDVNGRVVMSETLASETLTIDLNDVAKGAYFVRLTGEQSTVVRKLIVK